MKKLILLIAVLGLVSCGSRKTNRSKSKDELKSKIEMHYDVKASETSKTENDIIENKSWVTESKGEEKESRMKPLDPNRPMKRTETVNGNTKTTTWENAEVVENTKKETSKKSEESKLTDRTVLTSDSKFWASANLEQAEESTSEKLDKKSDAQRGFGFWWIPFIVLILLLIYYLQRKWKSIA
jgi:hypothetical protein